MFGSKAAKIGVRALGGVVAAAVLCVAVSGSTLAASRGSTSTDCQRDGWMVGQRSNGTTFSSKTACLVYVRFGGIVYKPSFIFDPSTVGINQDAWMHVTGFHPNDTGTLTQVGVGGPNDGVPFSFLGVPLNSFGNMAVISTAWTDSAACYDGTVGAHWTFTDSHGVHASAYVYLSCGRVG